MSKLEYVENANGVKFSLSLFRNRWLNIGNLLVAHEVKSIVLEPEVLKPITS